MVEAAVKAAEKIGALAVLPTQTSHQSLFEESNSIVPLYTDGEEALQQSFSSTPLVMVPDCENIIAVRDRLKANNPGQIIAVRIDVTPETTSRVLELNRDGIEVIHLVFDMHGRETAPSKPRHARDVLREIHTALLKDGTRDQITLIASGGIALPEHMAKAIICGADLIAVDAPLVLALECRLCLECERDELCPIDLEGAEMDYAVQRIVNLIGAWRNQLIELLGAMGIREVRRLRGETGRCMFFEDLERETFGRLFGKRKDQNGVI